MSRLLEAQDKFSLDQLMRQNDAPKKRADVAHAFICLYLFFFYYCRTVDTDLQIDCDLTSL